MYYCEGDKDRIIDKIDSIYGTVTNNLLPAYSDIEGKAKIIEKEKLQELKSSYSPNSMDSGELAYEEAFCTGAEYYTLQNKMKKEFLLSVAIWFFHLFEKDCNKMCLNPDIKFKDVLIKHDIPCDIDSDWYFINNELRLVANVAKHGEGSSSSKLKKIRIDFFKSERTFLSGCEIEITCDDIHKYVQRMKSFWESFFDKVLPKYD